jgi:DNA-binding CsgD family transcriptional regulator
VLFGRSDELAAIDAALTLLDDGRAVAVSIVGDAGIGKSALLDTALAAAARTATVLRVASSALEQTTPWSALSVLLDQIPGGLIDTLPEPQRAALDTALGRRTGGPTDIGSAVSTSLRDLLRRMISDRAVVLGIDDAQWIDAETASTIANAVRTLHDDRLAVVVTSRRMHDSAVELERILGRRSVTVEPSPLGRSDLQALLRHRGLTVTSPMLDDVDALVSGNPLHTHLLADHIERSGWPAGPLPTSISAGYLARTDRLSDPAASTLVIAALVGSTDLDLLAACLPQLDVEAALIEIERAGLTTIHSDDRGRADDIAHIHPIVAAIVTDRIGPVERRRHHRTIADALGPGDERRAHHLGASCTRPDAAVADALDDAALASLARGARHAAGLRFLRAAELTPPDAIGDRWRRNLAAADAFFGAGALDLAEAPSIDAFEDASDPMQLALAGGVRTQVLAARGNVAETHAFVVDLLARLDGIPMLQGLLGRARVRLEQIFDLGAAEETAQDLLGVMEAAGLQDLATEFTIATANCRFVRGQPVDVEDMWTRGRPIVNVADFIGAGWMALEMLVWGCHDEDLVESALDHFEQGATAAGSTQSLAKVFDFRGNHLIRRGEWEAGEIQMRRAVDAATLSELTGSMAEAGLAWLLAATGRIDEATATLATSASATASDDTLLIKVSHLASAGFIEFCAGRWESAVDVYGLAWSDADKLGLDDLCALPFRVDLIEALILCGRTNEAGERTEHIVDLAHRSERFAALMQAERAETLVFAARGDVDGALAATERALVHHRRADLPIERARLHLAIGSALRRAGRRQHAGVALDDAASIFARLGATPFLTRTQEELARLGRRRDPHELTGTEAQIARLVAAGKTNAEVAAELIVSLRTVESNLTRIYRKLSIRSRSELAARMRDSA